MNGSWTSISYQSLWTTRLRSFTINSSSNNRSKYEYRVVSIYFFLIWDKNGIKIPNAALMHVACFSGSYDCVKFLIRCSADVGILDIFNSIELMEKFWKKKQFYKIYFLFLIVRLYISQQLQATHKLFNCFLIMERIQMFVMFFICFFSSSSYFFIMFHFNIINKLMEFLFLINFGQLFIEQLFGIIVTL